MKVIEDFVKALGGGPGTYNGEGTKKLNRPNVTKVTQPYHFGPANGQSGLGFGRIKFPYKLQ
jgi:hypothetical protein